MTALEPYLYKTLLYRYKQAYKRLFADDLSAEELINLNDTLFDIQESLLIAYKQYRIYQTMKIDKKRI